LHNENFQMQSAKQFFLKSIVKQNQTVNKQRRT
jgi:hypothetical protein